MPRLPRRRRQMRVKSRYNNPPIADTSPGVSQRPSELSGLLADVPTPGFDAAAHTSGDDASLAVQQQVDALNEAEQSLHDRTIAFQKQMVALHPEQYRESVATPPPLTPRQQPRDFFRPPTARRPDSS